MTTKAKRAMAARACSVTVGTAPASQAVAKEYETAPIRLRAKVLAARACLIRAQEAEDGTGDPAADAEEASALRWEARDMLTELDAALQALARVTL